MSAKRSLRSLSRRDVLLGAGALVAATRSGAAEVRSTPARVAPRFDPQAFIEDCRHASQNTADAQAAVQEVMSRAMSAPNAVLAGVGEPQKGGIQTLFRSPELTILNIAWAPLMQLMPHEHRMWSVIGIYTGREDNIFWQRREGRVVAVKAASLSRGNVVPLAADIIHSVANPIGKLTGAIHVYGGDFFATPRSEWDPETLAEREWNLPRAIRLFQESNDRFYRDKERSACR